jgi:hypothetical protein
MENVNLKNETPADAKPVLSEGLRYWVQIQFKGQYGLIRAWDITEEVKTLKEAQSYKSMIDSSVSKAQIVDTVTMKVVEQWV